MSDREALLAAIRANPDDDTPRLVFADWLDENEPDAKRRAKKAAPKPASPSAWASLIRAECEFERLRNDGSDAAAVFDYFAEKDDQTLDAVRWDRALPGVSRLVELRKLIRALRQASKKARAAGLPKPPRGGWWMGETRRGFPEGFHAGNSRALAAALSSLIGSVPPAQIEFHNAESVLNPDELIAAGLARWSRELSLVGGDSHARLVYLLSRSLEAAGVRRFSCRWWEGEQLAPILSLVAGSPNWSGLRELAVDASVNAPAPLPAELFAAPHLRGLTRLSVSSAIPGAEALAGLGRMAELRALSLTHSDIGDLEAESLADSPGLANLRYLDLSFNRITGRGATVLLTSPHLKNLAVLDFEGNRVRGLDRAALAKGRAGGLRVLNLQSNRLTATDVTAITSSPRVRELVYFAACYNPFPESAVARLVKGFGDFAPAVLYLMGNRITAEGAKALANWSAAERIDMLHLSGNTLSVPGAKAIAGSPHLRQLNHICAGCKGDKGEQILRECFGDRADV